MELPQSVQANKRLHDVVPGGAHTYAKGDDQFPADLAPVISHGRGAHVWDIDGNSYVEYGSGLRSVSLGHAHPAVTAAVRTELERGSNFVRPSIVELTAAERFLAAVPTADMVKFAKNGSDVTTAAVRLARAATGRPLVRAYSMVSPNYQDTLEFFSIKVQKRYIFVKNQQSEVIGCCGGVLIISNPKSTCCIG